MKGRGIRVSTPTLSSMAMIVPLPRMPRMIMIMRPVFAGVAVLVGML